MPEDVHRIHSLPEDAPWQSGLPPVGSAEHPIAIRALDGVLAVQRPVVLAHLRSMRLRHPEATPAQIVRMLERRYLAGVTAGGAAVGATAVVPGIGTGVTLALSGVETAGFLEATTLFAQSLAEVHGFAVESPDRSRALVLTLMLGGEGVALVRQLAGQALGKGASLSTHWGDLIAKSLPKAAVGPLVDRLKKTFIHQFAARGGASFVGKALPFGVGAAVGGAGNHLLGRRVVQASRRAFGEVPERLPSAIEPRPGAERIEHVALHGLEQARSAMWAAAGSVGAGLGAARRGIAAAGDGAGRAGRGAAGSVRRALSRRTDDRAESADPERDDDAGERR
ncbi:hypothetical protein N8K70_09965 [Microbacterium betulae]|uniref:Di-and tripeptidase n=1 Tax=Microbacterium betulae TaxID=2981139 RepID=A0AA97FEV0_9MICO|nr:hypothetical protein [Microbacterium sp. AB]WOF21715.1 hypothetical protein N8K70_09965 [Microbacterium sp. AB]